MIPRRILAVLVYGFPILVVALAVAAGGGLLLQSAGDNAAATVLRWISGGLLGLLVINATLLLGALGVQSLGGQSLGGRAPGDDNSEANDSTSPHSD